MPAPPRVILASTSLYRAQLMQRLHVPFEAVAPDADETPQAGETPRNTAVRLARLKAESLASSHPHAIIVGSDQVACIGDRVFGKPLVRERAIQQLQLMRGQTIVFHTALCVINGDFGRLQEREVPTEVRVRKLSDEEIIRYVDRDQPYACAGSAKVEALGITLLEHIRGDDPTALIGLPLIALSEILRAEGFALP